VTFLFTDIEGSTHLWESVPDAMRSALARHDTILRNVIEAYDGHVFATGGDGLAAAFTRTGEAVAAAVEAQHQLSTEAWSEEVPIRVRMGLNTGEAEERDGDYFGPTLNRAARLMTIGHGGQILCSQVTADLVREALPLDIMLRDLGMHRLRDLTEPMRVFQVLHPGLRSRFPPLRSLDTLPGNLPRQITTFVGREPEIKQLVALIHERPLVTLTGVGGVGKTRLAVQVAAEVVADFTDGAWLCELAPVVDPGAVWETLAATLGVAPIPGQDLADALLDYLTRKRLLLVLDNCEHLLGAVARMASAIAGRCPLVVVLATSREGLALAGEHLVAVPSLGVPVLGATGAELGDSEAVRLFCTRAQDVDAEFSLNEQNAGAIAQLCRRLDGIPLAIELAAVRVRSLSPEDLVARLDQRFKLLTRGGRAALERHQTLRQAIDWSYELLTEPERSGLNRLAVFAGGCDLAAAEAVLDPGEGHEFDPADLVGQLVDKSLVMVDHGGPRTRFRLLETIRQYAQERLEFSGDLPTARRLHLAHYVALAETAGPHLRSRDQLEWAARLAPDIDNLRGALDYAIEASLPDPALRLVAGLAVSGLPIGMTATGWADAAHTIPGATAHPLFPCVVAYAALDTTLAGDMERAGQLVACAEEAQARLGTGLPPVYAAAAALAFFRGEFDVSRWHAEKRLELGRSAADQHEIAHALLQIAATLLDDPTRGTPIAVEAVRVARDAGLLSVLPYSLALYINFVRHDDERELATHEEMIAVATALGDRRLAAAATASRESIKARHGDWTATLRANASAAAEFRDGGNLTIIFPFLRAAATALIALEHYEPGAVLYGFADSHFVETGSDEYKTYVARGEAALADALDEVRLSQLKAVGAAFTFVDAIDFLCVEADRALSE
jgi:predicted ATPase/class 3 adenylate cyclase